MKVQTFVCLYLLVCVHTCPSVCLSQHHESVLLATAETSKAGLRASSFWLDGSLCCSWGTRQQRERREKRTNPPPHSSTLSSPLSRSVAPSSTHCFFFFSLLHLSLPFFSLSFAVLSYEALSLPLPLNSSCSFFLSSVSLSLCTTARSWWHRGMADGPLWSSRQLQDFGGFHEFH